MMPGIQNSGMKKEIVRDAHISTPAVNSCTGLRRISGLRQRWHFGSESLSVTGFGVRSPKRPSRAPTPIYKRASEWHLEAVTAHRLRPDVFVEGGDERHGALDRGLHRRQRQ